MDMENSLRVRRGWSPSGPGGSAAAIENYLGDDAPRLPGARVCDSGQITIAGGYRSVDRWDGTVSTGRVLRSMAPKPHGCLQSFFGTREKTRRGGAVVITDIRLLASCRDEGRSWMPLRAGGSKSDGYQAVKSDTKCRKSVLAIVLGE